MAKLINPFNANQIAPETGGMEQLPISTPEGWPVAITASEFKETNDGSGAYILMTLEIIEGPNQGAKGTDLLNLYNNNQQAVEISNKRLSAYCHVTGVFDVQDTVQLHNIPFRVIVSADKKDSAKTRIVAVRDASGAKPGQAGTAPATTSNNAFAQPAQPAQAFTQPVAQAQVQQPVTAQPAATQPPAQQWSQQPAQAQVAQPAVAQPAFQQAVVPDKPNWQQR